MDPHLSMLTSLEKGMPGRLQPFDRADIGRKGWNVLAEDLPLPLAVLKQEAVAHNSRWMQDFLELTGARIAPHGKTSMSPQLFDLQLADGAWALTVSTPHQLHVARAFGYKRIVLANQLVGRNSIRYVLEELRDDSSFDFYCLVDSVVLVERLAREAREMDIGRPLKLLLECGYTGGRTGCRTVVECMAVANSVRSSFPHLELAGVEGFEGLIKEQEYEATLRRVRAFLSFVKEVAVRCDDESLFTGHTVLLSAGGSTFYDIVVAELATLRLSRSTTTVTRSGCYLTQDSVQYAASDANVHLRNPHLGPLDRGLRPAIEVWAYVQSRPEPGLVVATVGKRDVSTDHLPVLEQWFRPDAGMTGPALVPSGHRVLGLNDQHLKLEVPLDSPFQVGDMLAFGIDHPCLTFDKWRVMVVINEKYDVVDAVQTYF
ncbi:MAG: alanine racemase domain protein [Polaromonas sp.]|nr:alanine racemase domain protein [Polaromonas sp.]